MHRVLICFTYVAQQDADGRNARVGILCMHMPVYHSECSAKLKPNLDNFDQ